MIRLTTGHREAAESIVLDDLLPLCLRTKDEWPDRNMRRRYDEVLRGWLDTFSGADRAELRDAVLATVRRALDGPRLAPACGTILTLAYRTKELVDALDAITSAHDGNDGDLALRTRVQLGVTDADRAGIVAELHRRATSRWNYSLVAALEELADRDSLEVIFSHGLRRNRVTS